LRLCYATDFPEVQKVGADERPGDTGDICDRRRIAPAIVKAAGQAAVASTSPGSSARSDEANAPIGRIVDDREARLDRDGVACMGL
jgi:hypothetical protein